MSGSQAPAVETSRRARVQQFRERAALLEAQLVAACDKDERQAATLRAQLCELWSDWLLLDPWQAQKEDVMTRLWRGCFYDPINKFRKVLQKQQQQPQQQNARKNFYRFLQEAIPLYDYLLEQYQSKLLLATASSPPTTETATTTTTTDVNATSAKALVQGLYRLFIYLGDLYRYQEAFTKAQQMYSKAAQLAPGLGNPYNQLAVTSQLMTKTSSHNNLKNSNSNNKSSTNVAKMNQNCVALSWYVRSLLATHVSFDTSRANLHRLFQAHRQTLREHGRTSSPIIYNSSHNQDKKKQKKMSSSGAVLLRSQKQVAIQSCLDHLVDFSYELQLALHREKDNNNGKQEIFSKEEQLEDRMEALCQSIESLIQASTFSDGLLLKLVIIITFHLHESRQESSQTDASLHRICQVWLLRLGTCLAQKLEKGLVKMAERKRNNRINKHDEKMIPLPSTIRFLLPFLVVFEIIVHREHEFGTNADNPCSRSNFWNAVVALAQPSRFLVDTNNTSWTDANVSSTQDIVWKLPEYQLLQGYQPFAFLNPEYAQSKPVEDDAYVQPEHAKGVLELTVNHDDEKHQTQQNPTASRQEQEELSKMRLARFWHLVCSTCTQTSSNIPLVMDRDGGISYQQEEPGKVEAKNHSQEQQDGHDSEVLVDRTEDQDNDALPMPFSNNDEDTDDEAGDVVMGPALAVRKEVPPPPKPQPSAMATAGTAQGSVSESVPAYWQGTVPNHCDHATIGSTSEGIPGMGRLSTVTYPSTRYDARPETVIQPPPGFGFPQQTVTHHSGPHASHGYPASSAPPPYANGYMGVGFGFGTPLQGMAFPGPPAPPNNTQAHSSPFMDLSTVLQDSFRPTQNPFSTDYRNGGVHAPHQPIGGGSTFQSGVQYGIPRPGGYPTMPGNFSPYNHMQQEYSPQPATLLPTDFLESLLQDGRSETQNPFAT